MNRTRSAVLVLAGLVVAAGPVGALSGTANALAVVEGRGIVATIEAERTHDAGGLFLASYPAGTPEFNLAADFAYDAAGAGGEAIFVTIDIDVPRLEGTSAGLAMALSVMSLLQEVSLPSDVAATGSVAPDATIGGVSGLEMKIDAAASAHIRQLLAPLAQATPDNQALCLEAQIDCTWIGTLDEAAEAVGLKPLGGRGALEADLMASAEVVAKMAARVGAEPSSGNGSSPLARLADIAAMATGDEAFEDLCSTIAVESLNGPVAIAFQASATAMQSRLQSSRGFLGEAEALNLRRACAAEALFALAASSMNLSLPWSWMEGACPGIAYRAISIVAIAPIRQARLDAASHLEHEGKPAAACLLREYAGLGAAADLLWPPGSDRGLALHLALNATPHLAFPEAQTGAALRDFSPAFPGSDRLAAIWLASSFDVAIGESGGESAPPVSLSLVAALLLSASACFGLPKSVPRATKTRDG